MNSIASSGPFYIARRRGRRGRQRLQSASAPRCCANQICARSCRTCHSVVAPAALAPLAIAPSPPPKQRALGARGLQVRRQRSQKHQSPQAAPEDPSSRRAFTCVPSISNYLPVLAPLSLYSRRHHPPDAFFWNGRGMNTSLTAYTPLESLLLFQSLALYGVEPSIFSRISDLLKNNPHITSAERFESGRLSPDALRNFYLQILKEEAKSELQDGTRTDGEAQNGEIKNSRKRKAPSPSLPTVQEATQHSHLIPKLVPKLYARYRSHATDQIRDEERRYAILRRELGEIERGEWDHKLQSQEKVNGESPLPKSQTVLSGGQQIAAKESFSLETSAIDGQNNGTPRQTAPEANQKSPDLRQGQDQNESALHLTHPPASRGRHLSMDQRSRQSTPQTIPGQMPSPSPFNRIPHVVPPAKLPQQPGPVTEFNGSPTTTHRSPYPPQLQGPQASTPQMSPIASSATLSPATLPLAQQMQYPPQPPPQPISPFTGNNVPQYGPPSGQSLPYSPTQQRYPMQYPPPGPVSPGMQTQQQRNYYSQYPPSQPQYASSSHQPPTLVQPPPQGGFMLPPFQVAPQDPSPSHAQQSQSKPGQQTPASTPVRPPVTSSKSNKSRSSQAALPPNPFAGQPTGPISTPSSIRTPQPPLSVSTPSSYTRWKPSAHKAPEPLLRSPTMSPIEDVQFDFPPQTASGTKARRKTNPKSKAPAKSKGKNKEHEAVAEPDPQVSRSTGRTAKGSGRRQRFGSTTSSIVASSTRGRSRSQSIAETVSADNDNEPNTAYHVKIEPRPSVDIAEEDNSQQVSGTRKRRRGNRTASQSQPLNKRARTTIRESSIPDSEDPDTGTPTIASQNVIAPRHFAKMAHPIMNSIDGHRHATFFLAPVKGIEGYTDIIKRPQDLGSIKKAISAGAKTVSAAASTMSSDTLPGSPGGAGGNVILPISADVVPPKAIVNPAQLEKELMRVFANAVMFNSGEEENMVLDAREMSEHVQGIVSQWRAVERTSVSRMESEDITAPATEEEQIGASDKGTGKRRKG